MKRYSLWLVATVALLGCSEETPGSGSGAGAGSGASAGATAAGQSGVGGAAAGGAGAGGGSSGASGAGSAGGPSGGAGLGGSAQAGGGAGGAGTGASGSGGASGAAGGGYAGQGGDGAGAAGLAGAGAGAGGTSGDGGASASGGAGSGGMAGGSTLPPITDYSDDGPFQTIIDKNVGPGGGYTVFRPQPLGENGFLHAPIIFGPGIGQQVTVHTTMLTTFASQGFVVVGVNLLSGGPGDAGNRMKMLDGLNWILGENTAQGIYQGKLDVTHAVSMGFSVGGTSAVEIGGETAVATVVSIHGHKATAALHGPMLQTTGTQDTVGMPLQQQTYDMSQVPTFLATLTGAPHQYIESNGGGEERPAIVAWMRYFIYGDMGAASYFYGDDCVLCKSPWENPQRKNWQ